MRKFLTGLKSKLRQGLTGKIAVVRRFFKELKNILNCPRTDQDGSYTRCFRWKTFIGTFALAIILAYITIVSLSTADFCKWHSGWNCISGTWNNKGGQEGQGGPLSLVLPTTVFAFFLSLWGIFFRTEDKKKEFLDNYQQKNDNRISTALGLLFSDDNKPQAKAAGLRELIQIKNNSNTEQADKERIDQYTSYADLSRRKHPNDPNLPLDINLRKADISGAILIGANLTGVQLLEANLSGADMSEAILHDAQLQRANLSEANLTSVELSKVNLHGANLMGADLTRVTFSDTTTLSDANLVQTILKDTRNNHILNCRDSFYDKDTVFPSEFDPVGKGMRIMEWIEFVKSVKIGDKTFGAGHQMKVPPANDIYRKEILDGLRRGDIKPIPNPESGDHKD